jgi:hypothetical protein
VKRLLQGRNFGSEEGLLAAMEALLSGIEKRILIAVFQEWMQRL